jgi:magnesium transporter
MAMLIYNELTKHVTTEKVRMPLENEVVWIRLLSPEAEEVKHILENLFECHPLLVEDCIKLNQRPKMDRYKNNIFISFFSINQEYVPIEIALVVGSNYVISIYKEQIPILDNLYEEFNIFESKMEHPGEILYQIMDRCVDEYVNVIDHIEDKVEEWEIAIHENPYAKVAQDIFRMKRMAHELRRIFVEERTMLGTISHQNFPYTTKESDVYFVDIFDHISRVLDSIDIFRESLKGLMEMQMSLKGDRMNEIMKVLTVFSTIFLPLSFIVGLYGMNLKGIPEYEWSFGYIYVWILMIISTIAMIFFFKKKKWL